VSESESRVLGRFHVAVSEGGPALVPDSRSQFLRGPKVLFGTPLRFALSRAIGAKKHKPLPIGTSDRLLDRRREGGFLTILASTAVRGPLAVQFRPLLRSLCGPNPHEQPRIQANNGSVSPYFRGYSPVFAAVRGSLRQSGRKVQIGFPMRFPPFCGLFAVLGQVRFRRSSRSPTLDRSDFFAACGNRGGPVGTGA
jgi:hypothetical protein